MMTPFYLHRKDGDRKQEETEDEGTTVSPCNAHLCLNGGILNESGGSCNCLCKPGYFGENNVKYLGVLTYAIALMDTLEKTVRSLLAPVIPGGRAAS